MWNAAAETLCRAAECGLGWSCPSGVRLREESPNVERADDVKLARLRGAVIYVMPDHLSPKDPHGGSIRCKRGICQLGMECFAGRIMRDELHLIYKPCGYDCDICQDIRTENLVHLRRALKLPRAI